MNDQHLLWEELFEEQLNFFKRLSGSSIVIIYICIIEHERLGKINSNDSDILSEPKPTTQEIISLLNKKLRHRKLFLYL